MEAKLNLLHGHQRPGDADLAQSTVLFVDFLQCSVHLACISLYTRDPTEIESSFQVRHMLPSVGLEAI